MTVDLAPLVQVTVSLAALGLSTVGMWALMRLARKLGIQTTQAQQQQVEIAINKAVQAGAVYAESAAEQHGWAHPQVKSMIVGQAINYAVARFPDTLKAAGIDPSDPADAEKLRGAIQRALPAAVTPVAASPATTNGPAVIAAVTTAPTA